MKHTLNLKKVKAVYQNNEKGFFVGVTVEEAAD